jgi:hypothetical protein
MTKYCPQCREVKSVNQFAKHKNRADGLQSACKDCQHKRAKVYFQANKEKFNNRNTHNRRRNQIAVAEFLKDKACVDCGVTNPVVLTFDHVRDKKFMEVSNLVKQSYSLTVIFAEIAKCDIRCFNCHQIKDSLSKRGGFKWNALAQASQ